MFDVVIVDDDTHLSQLVSHFLEEEGITTTTFSKPPATQKIAALQPKIILIDCWYEDELAGPRFARQLKQDPSDSSKIVLMSSDPRQKEAVLKEQLDGCVEKPFNWEQFDELITELLAEAH